MTVVAMVACLVVLIALAEPAPPRRPRHTTLFFGLRTYRKSRVHLDPQDQDNQ